MSAIIQQLGAEDTFLYRELMMLFSEAFEDPANYESNSPSDEYVESMLKKEHMIFLIAMENDKVIGGLVAYVLDKFEQQRSETYIYDLAVSQNYRRRGIATQLIHALKPIARQHGSWVIFVQADYDDPPANKLYESMGIKEQVLHFDINVDG